MEESRDVDAINGDFDALMTPDRNLRPESSNNTCRIEECDPKPLTKDPLGNKIHLGYGKWISQRSWDELEKIADNSKFVQHLTVEACGVDSVHLFSATGTQGPKGPKRGEAGYKEKFPAETIAIVHHFLKLKLMTKYGESYTGTPSNEEFAIKCPRTAGQLDGMTNCINGVPRRRNSLGQMGTWMTRASTENSPNRPRHWFQAKFGSWRRGWRSRRLWCPRCRPANSASSAKGSGTFAFSSPFRGRPRFRGVGGGGCSAALLVPAPAGALGKFSAGGGCPLVDSGRSPEAAECPIWSARDWRVLPGAVTAPWLTRSHPAAPMIYFVDQPKTELAPSEVGHPWHVRHRQRGRTDGLCLPCTRDCWWQSNSQIPRGAPRWMIFVCRRLPGAVV
ncbi:uncharacterized protein LOC132196093 [Neocloeon triangulifer]|uniref:uncharacterized protein LOC132196093 n=1 Tax=Neocloeon triangulifer TaxID=2078957 RepID=UPI00286F9720|nr:uncharacterized protein LOC132196093 [Neocloeon triangulifer]